MKRILALVVVLTSIIIAQDFDFVGNTKCKMCHKKVEAGEQYAKWEASLHAKSFETLKSESSAKIAADMGISVNAWEAPECLKCHTTGFGVGGYEVKDEDFWNPEPEDKTGVKAVKRMNGLQAVGCEACHGPGSKYKSKKTMQAIFAGELDGTTVGLIKISEKTCTGCHNEESPTYKPFNYEERNAEIAHPIPEKE